MPSWVLPAQKIPVGELEETRSGLITSDAEKKMVRSTSPSVQVLELDIEEAVLLQDSNWIQNDVLSS